MSKYNKPYKSTTPEYYNEKLYLKYRAYKPLSEEEFSTVNLLMGKKIQIPPRPILLAAESKNKNLYYYGFLKTFESINFVINKRVAELLNNLCPGDIQLIPTRIEHINGEVEYNVANDYYILNILNKLDLIDRENSIVHYKNGRLRFEDVHFKTADHMMDHYIVREENLTFAMFHPKLVGKLKDFKGIEFMTDKGYRTLNPYSTPMWSYLHRYYKNLIFEHNLNKEFYAEDGYKKVPLVLEKFKGQIYLNYCPNCGNLKETPKARQCLECQTFADPV